MNHFEIYKIIRLDKYQQLFSTTHAIITPRRITLSGWFKLHEGQEILYDKLTNKIWLPIYNYIEDIIRDYKIS